MWKEITSKPDRNQKKKDAIGKSSSRGAARHTFQLRSTFQRRITVPLPPSHLHPSHPSLLTPSPPPPPHPLTRGEPGCLCRGSPLPPSHTSPLTPITPHTLTPLTRGEPGCLCRGSPLPPSHPSLLTPSHPPLLTPSPRESQAVSAVVVQQA